MKSFPSIISILLLSVPALSQHVPSFEEMISLRCVVVVTMSPDGKDVAFGVQSTDWNDNRYDTEIWLSRNGGAPYQLTNTSKGNSSNRAFSPDGKWLAFLANRGNKDQIHVIRVDGGEAKVVTN